MQGKYILQYGSLAGWPHKVAEALRAKHINSQNVILYDRDVLDLNRKLPYDRALCRFNDSAFKKGLEIFKYIFDVPKEVKLIHYHSGTIFLRQYHHLLEGPYFTKKNIPMLLSFGGTDARITSIASKHNPYFHLPVSEKYDDKIKRKLDSMSKYIRYCATDPEMLSYVEGYFDKSFLFRQPVNLEQIECIYPSVNNDTPIILHVPTNPEVKGTKFLQAAIDKLTDEGLKFKFKFIRQLTQTEMYKEISKADIYVDELRVGCHGVTAVETMAAGKPTITYIREDLVEKFPPDFPIVNANPDTIYSKLKELILDANLRRDIGIASRKYVEKYHDATIVADDLLKIYREIGFKE